MKLKIVNKKDNPFLERTEYLIEVDHSKEPTPSAAAVQKVVAKELKSVVEKTEIVSIRSGHGVAKSTAKIYVWKKKTVPDLEKLIVEKKKAKEEEPRKEKPEEEKKEEIKTEKKIEEKEEIRETPKEKIEEKKPEKKDEKKDEKEKS